MKFLKFECFLFDFSHFSRNFLTNKKSRKSLLHKDFRDFDFRQIFRNRLRLCGSALKNNILICANIRKSMCTADVYIKRILFANVIIMQNYRLEKRSKGKNNYIFVIKNQLFSKIIISILAIIIDKD